MKAFKNILFVVIGSFITAYGAVVFLNPNSMVTGGGVGLAQLFYAMTGLFTLGSWIAIVAVPLMVVGWIYFGKGYVAKTILSIILISGFSDLLLVSLEVAPVTDQSLLAGVFGGLLVGLGVGSVMLGHSSTGGTTVIGEVVALKTRYKTSQILLFIDGLIMLSSIFVFGDVEKSLYSVIGVYMTARMIDRLISGKPSQKAISIVTNNIDIVSKEIYRRIGEHGTILYGENINRNDSRKLILVVVDFSEFQLVKEIVAEHDPDAFILVQEASELHGRDY